jgi:hypothetical protein
MLATIRTGDTNRGPRPHGKEVILSLQQLFETQDWTALAMACESRFGVSVNADELASRTEMVVGKHKRLERRAFGCCWGDGTWLMFLKSRLEELGCFKNGCQIAVEGGCTAVMHVFFINIEETPEMVARLRNEKPDQIAVARTKLNKDTSVYVEPIDGNAAKVVH